MLHIFAKTTLKVSEVHYTFKLSVTKVIIFITKGIEFSYGKSLNPLAYSQQ